ENALSCERLGGRAPRHGLVFRMLGQVGPCAQITSFGGLLPEPMRRWRRCWRGGWLCGLCLGRFEVLLNCDEQRSGFTVAWLLLLDRGQQVGCLLPLFLVEMAERLRIPPGELVLG